MARQRRRKVTERRGFWFRLCILVIWPTAQLLTRRNRAGMEKVPAEGGVLLVANHVSVVDPLTMAQFVYDSGRLPHFMAKASLFTAPVIGRIMRGARQIPVARGTADAAGALAAALTSLQAGNAVIIFPEGTTTRDPALWPMRARTGVARLALSADVPVFPVSQWGAHAIKSRGSGLRAFARPTVTMRVGEPLDLTPWQGRDQTPAVLREVTDLIMAAIIEPLAEIRGEPAPPGAWDPRTEAYPVIGEADGAGADQRLA
jgi:1-acyl-sn-glycerol-3-phosphate acyltransferase